MIIEVIKGDKLMKKLLLSLLAILVLTACTKAPAEKPQNPTDHNVPEVTLMMENGDKILIELYPNIAPNTVNNFISLIEDGFYDGLIFHRVIPGFMVQGGDPDGQGTGGPGYSIAGEFSSNGFENTLEHKRGVLSMARAQHPDSAGSQFFIMSSDSPHLDGDYAAFGKVVDNIEAVDTVVSAERGANDRPTEGNEQIIKTVTVDLKGYEPAELKKMN